MPELPEVEAARRAAEAHLVGRRILSVVVAEDEKVLEGCSAEEVRAALQGRVVVGAGRKGKHLWLLLDQPPMPLFHFGMAGAFAIKGENVVRYKRLAVSPADEWPPRFHKLVLQAEGGVQLAFTDARRFGRIRLAPDPLLCPPVAQLGPDVLLSLPDPASFAALLRRRSRAVKALLMDQAVLSGIGNWLADEVLYQSQLHPETPSALLTDAHCSALHSSIQQVISKSVAVDADSDRFPPSWLFHVRWSKKPGSIAGHPLSFITVAGRTSAIVPANSRRQARGDSKGTGAAVAARAAKSRVGRPKREEREEDEARQDEEGIRNRNGSESEDGRGQEPLVESGASEHGEEDSIGRSIGQSQTAGSELPVANESGDDSVGARARAAPPARRARSATAATPAAAAAADVTAIASGRGKRGRRAVSTATATAAPSTSAGQGSGVRALSVVEATEEVKASVTGLSGSGGGGGAVTVTAMGTGRVTRQAAKRQRS
ncbi:unnamed protein product [Closterium sp. Naga37s-1]|nr:unnamed protein product [Closterium sp. Naga37s-1]